jgi:hypothetical protein
MQFSQLRRPPFDEAKIHELRERLNRIPGVHLPEDSVTKYPSIQLSLPGEESARRLFLDALEWRCGRSGTRKRHPPGERETRPTVARG